VFKVPNPVPQCITRFEMEESSSGFGNVDRH